MKINGNQREELGEAIISAYPDLDDLEIVVKNSDVLKGSLRAIAWKKSPNVVVSKLIEWAESHGKLEDLIITVYQKNKGNPELKKFYQSVFEQRFILNPTPGDTIRDIRPEIIWQGPEDERELQSYLQPEPDYWDVGFLKSAIDQAASVCRVEIPSQGIQGTGVLITDRCKNRKVAQPNQLRCCGNTVRLRFFDENSKSQRRDKSPSLQ